MSLAAGKKRRTMASRPADRSVFGRRDERPLQRCKAQIPLDVMRDPDRLRSPRRRSHQLKIAVSGPCQRMVGEPTARLRHPGFLQSQNPACAAAAALMSITALIASASPSRIGAHHVVDSASCGTRLSAVAWPAVRIASLKLHRPGRGQHRAARSLVEMVKKQQGIGRTGSPGAIVRVAPGRFPSDPASTISRERDR